MKRILLFFFVAAPFIVLGQKGKSSSSGIYLLDKDGKSCEQDKAVFLAELKNLDDTAYQWHFYQYAGPLIIVETYQDKDRSIPHGYFAWYDRQGKIDSCGYRLNGKKNGSWSYFTDSLTVWHSKKYANGILVLEQDSLALKADKRKMDSIGFLPGDKEAFYKGSDKTWLGYLQQNMELPDRAIQLKTQGVVIAFFMVASNGRLEDIRIYQSIEYSLDAQVREILEESPRWDPAIQLGRPVRAYRTQPFTFRW